MSLKAYNTCSNLKSVKLLMEKILHSYVSIMKIAEELESLSCIHVFHVYHDHLPLANKTL